MVGGARPVPAPVFKTGGARREAPLGGFDSHHPPPKKAGLNASFPLKAAMPAPQTSQVPPAPSAKAAEDSAIRWGTGRPLGLTEPLAMKGSLSMRILEDRR